jgi:hypothetical protein
MTPPKPAKASLQEAHAPPADALQKAARIAWFKDKGSATGKEFDAFNAGYLAASAQVREVEACQHDWVCGDNQYVSNVLMCRKCHAIKPANAPESVPVAQGDVEAEARRLFEANSAALRKVVAEMRKTAAMFPDSPFASTVRRWAKDLATASRCV